MAKSRANGTGSIVKCQGRKSPYRVSVTVGHMIDPVTGKYKQVTKSLGYFRTRKLAEEALVEYNIKPYNLDTKKVTFAELYAMWEPVYIANHVKSDNYIRGIRSAYNYCFSLYNMKLRDIKPVHLKECMDKGYVIPAQGKDKGEKRYATANTKARMKSLFNLMFDYALEHEFIITNPARAFKIDDSILNNIKENKKIKPAFTYNNMESLWKAYELEYPFADMVLIQTYTGYRASELVSIEVSQVFLNENIIYGAGNKTSAGKGRIVPIHPKIKPLVENYYNKAVEEGRDKLFFASEGGKNVNMTYSMYRYRFRKVMNFLGLPDSYVTHSCRVSFITMAKAYKMDEHLMKLIVGHSDPDLSERVYTRRVIRQLIEAMNVIPETLDDKYLSEDSILAIIQSSLVGQENLFA